MTKYETAGAGLLADMIVGSALLNVSLRDFFAAFALTGIAAANLDQDYSVDATMAYNYADQMLAQRKEVKP